MNYSDLFGFGGIILILSIFGFLATIIRTLSYGLTHSKHIFSSFPKNSPSKLNRASSHAPFKLSGVLPQNALELDLINQASKVGIVEQIADNGIVKRTITLWIQEPKKTQQITKNDHEDITIMGHSVKSY